MVNCLADIVQQTCTAGRHRVNAQLRCQNSGNMRHLNGVHEDILTIACTVTQSAKQLDKLRVQTVYPCFKGRAFALTLDDLVNFPTGFFHHFLNAGRVNPAIGNQLFERHSRNLAANGVKRRERNGFWCIINNEIHTGQRFNVPGYCGLRDR